MSNQEFTIFRSARWKGRARAVGVLLVSLWAGSTTAAAAPELCGARADLLKELTQRYSEAPVAIGLANSGALVEILTNDTGSTWSIMVSQPHGTSCLVAAGKEWQQLKPDADGRDLRVRSPDREDPT